jgi:ABC-type uncharacterized transport system permease subunit
MNIAFMNPLAAALYFSVGFLLWRDLRHGTRASRGARLGIFSLAAGAALLHAAVLYAGLLRDNALNLGLTNAISLVAWAVVLIYLLSALRRPIESLGIFILPTAALTILIEWLFPIGHRLMLKSTPLYSAHIIISLVAYSLLCIAVVQSIMLALQEKQLRSHHPGGVLRSLPPLETMESLMFNMIGLGFLLLTLTLISGIFFSEAVFGQPLRLTHHIVLSLIGWGVFGVLLLGRWRFGWRGRTALHWTLSGFFLLALGYFGSKFVLEVILHR